MSERNTFRTKIIPGSARVWALGVSIAGHIAALTTLAGLHFCGRSEAPAEAVSADVSVHVIEQVIEQPVPKPKPKIEPPPAPTVKPAVPKPVEPKPEPPKPPAPVQRPEPTETPRPPKAPDAVLFCGTTTAASRVCYVIDGSGSMFGLMYLVRQQVRESILHLAADQSFNVLCYLEGGKLLRAFGTRLERATPASKATALNLLGEIRPGGQTAAEPALRAALEMRDAAGVPCEVIYFVTDGFDLMDGGGQSFIQRAESLRKTLAPTAVVHTIGIYPGEEDRDLLTRMAQVCGGRFIEVK